MIDTDREFTIFICPCGYIATSPGRCRSHPFPARALGPPTEEVRVVPKSELEFLIHRAAHELRRTGMPLTGHSAADYLLRAWREGRLEP